MYANLIEVDRVDQIQTACFVQSDLILRVCKSVMTRAKTCAYQPKGCDGFDIKL